MMETIKMLLGITDNSQDLIIDFHIQDVTNAILDYCNIPVVPERLETLIISEVVGIMKGNNSAVKSIVRGDTEIQYKDDAQGTNVLKEVQSRLNAYRKVKFI